MAARHEETVPARDQSSIQDCGALQHTALVVDPVAAYKSLLTYFTDVTDIGAKQVPHPRRLQPSRKMLAKMALSCPTWRQDGPKMAILDCNMANLRPFREVSCPLLKILGAKSQIAENFIKTLGF